jgi:hypothetical protein
MLLLQANTHGSFSLISFTATKTPSCPILSHTRKVDNQEVTSQDLLSVRGHGKLVVKRVGSAVNKPN